MKFVRKAVAPPKSPIKEPGFTIMKARYAKNMMAVRCRSSGTGFKTRAMCLCEFLKARYSHREGAYIMSKKKTERLQELFDDGKDASPITGKLR